jgi:hypothetical protein
MTKFEIINNVLIDKNSKLSDKNEFHQNLPPNYLLQRYISMSSTENLLISNETINKIYSAFEGDKLMLYKMYMTMLKPRDYKYTYIKKSAKKVNEEELKKIKQYSERYEVPQREIKEWLNMKEKEAVKQHE